MRLDAALAARGEAASRAAAARLIDAGAVRVDGRRAPESHRLRAGELVERPTPRATPSPRRAEVPFEVVLEDEHLMVVDKPAGVVVHPGAGRQPGTLAQALARARGGGPGPRAARASSTASTATPPG